MILFVADYPGPENEKDGMMQRIAAVDARFSDVERSYLKISFVRFLRGEKNKRSDLLTVYRLNFFLHFLLIVYLACKANCIYVHSVGNALAILPFYLFQADGETVCCPALPVRRAGRCPEEPGYRDRQRGNGRPLP
jgi:hypothetical protein